MKRLVLFLIFFWVLIAVTIARLFRGPKRPGWTHKFEVGVELMRTLLARPGNLPPAALRADMPDAPVPRQLASRIAVEQSTLGGRPTEVHTPEGWKDGDPTLLYLHGGGYIVCSPGTHRSLIAQISAASGARCWAIDYRMAPEHPFPTGLEDAVAAYEELLSQGVKPSTLFIGGDSAGGGLTLATLLKNREDGRAQPAGALLLSPWVDLEGASTSIVENDRFDYLNKRGMDWAAAMYATDLRHPMVSPVHAELSELPPMIMQTGGAECFYDDNKRLAERAKEHGVEIAHEIYEHMVHVWQAFPHFQPDMRAAIHALGAFIKQRHAAPQASAAE